MLVSVPESTVPTPTYKLVVGVPGAPVGVMLAAACSGTYLMMASFGTP